MTDKAAEEDRQRDYAEKLLQAMDDDLAENVTVLDLLDDLACAGLRLAEDRAGLASRAYVRALTGLPAWSSE